MSNEVTNVSVANPMSLPTQDVESIQEKAKSDKSYVDVVKITYGVSPQFKDRSCEEGHWWFLKQDMGDTISAYIPRFAYSVEAREGSTFKAEIHFPYNETDYSSTQEYKDFIAKYPEHNFNEGVTLLLYINGEWGRLFCKKIIFDGAMKLISDIFGNSHFSYNLTLNVVVTKRKTTYVTMSHEPIDYTPNISINEINEKYEMILKPSSMDDNNATPSR